MRIVSLCPSITETLFAIGAGPSVVGITRYCTEPAEMLRGVTRVGGTKNPDIPAIGELQPDLVLMNAEENRQEDIERLRTVHQVDVTFPRSVADAPGLVRHLGSVSGCEAAASELAARIEAGLVRLASEPRQPFRYVYFVWKDPWMIAGAGTYIASVCALSGGLPLEGLAGSPDYVEVEPDWIRAESPDVILLPDEPYRFGHKHLEFWRKECPGSAAFLVPGDDFCWHGVRTLRGIDASCRLAADVAAVRSGGGREPVPAGVEGRHERDPRGSSRSEG